MLFVAAASRVPGEIRELGNGTRKAGSAEDVRFHSSSHSHLKMTTVMGSNHIRLM